MTKREKIQWIGGILAGVGMAAMSGLSERATDASEELGWEVYLFFPLFLAWCVILLWAERKVDLYIPCGPLGTALTPSPPHHLTHSPHHPSPPHHLTHSPPHPTPFILQTARHRTRSTSSRGSFSLRTWGTIR